MEQAAHRARLSPTIRALGLISLLSDWSHEMVTAVLPAFLVMLGAPAIALGLIEGISDSASSGVKYLGGSLADRRPIKPILIVGYTTTAILKPLTGIATAWGQVLGLRTAAWMGRGLREAPRNVLLTTEASPGGRGRAFGYHRAMDTIGAIAGPACAALLLALGVGLRPTILLAAIPGVASVIVVIVGIRHRRPVAQARPQAQPTHPLRDPRYRRLLMIVGLFGCANFAHTFFILRATNLLTSGQGFGRAATIAVALYVVFNIAYASVSYPMGLLADRFGPRRLLFGGYILFGLIAWGFAAGTTSIALLGVLFLSAGLYMGIVDALEPTLASTYLPIAVRGRGFGLLGETNGVGDLVASVGMGVLYTLAGAGWAFGITGSVAILAGIAGQSPLLSRPATNE